MADNFRPMVASIIPVLNEADSISDCLTSLCNQSYPAKLHQIHIFDGGSTDDTWKLAEDFIKTKPNSYPEIFLHHNPGKYVAEARNLSLEVVPKTVEYFLEIIGHCLVSRDHIDSLVKTMGQLQQSTNNNVGALGVSVVSKGGNLALVESWIEAGMLSPLVRGNGQFAIFSGVEETNVPAFCLHYRKALTDVGGWDTRFITSQDSDISMRMKKHGYQLFRTGSVKVKMAKRSTLTSWSKMGFRYGFWRTKLMKRHLERASIREFLPWFGVVLTLLLLFSANKYWWLPPCLYLAVISLEGIRSAIVTRKISSIVGVPLVIICLHTSFSIGLLYGLFGKTRSFNERELNKSNLN